MHVSLVVSEAHSVGVPLQADPDQVQPGCAVHEEETRWAEQSRTEPEQEPGVVTDHVQPVMAEQVSSLKLFLQLYTGIPEHAAAVVVVHVQPGCVVHVLELVREAQVEGVPVHEGSVVVQAQPAMAAQVEEDGELQVPRGVPVHPAGLVSDHAQPGCAAHEVAL